MEKNEAKNMSTLILAYLGDSVYELLVRERLIESGFVKNNTANKKALEYVTARMQSEAVERILPYFDEDEEDIFRRGKNANIKSFPRNVSPLEYKKATGLEAVFAYNHLIGCDERNRELFNIAFPVEN